MFGVVSGPSDRARGGGGAGPLEDLLDSATPSAPDWGAADADEGDPLMDFGLDAAVRRLEAELAHEKTAGPSAIDVLGDMASVTAAAAPIGGTGRVVGAPPMAPPERKSDLDDTARGKHGSRVMRADAPTSADLGRPELGHKARATPVDTGPIHGDPFGGNAALAPANPGQSHIGMGVGRRPVPGDFYGRDTPPPPGAFGVPGPAYGDSGPMQAVPTPVPTPVPSADAFVPYSAEASHSSTAAGAMSADSMPTLGAHTSASWAAMQAAEDEHGSRDDVLPIRDGNTQRTAVEARPVPDEPRSRRWIGFAMAGVMLGSVAAAVVLRPALLGGEDEDTAAVASAAVVDDAPPAQAETNPEAEPKSEADTPTSATQPSPDGAEADAPAGRRTPPPPGTASTHGTVTLEISPKGSRVFALADGPDHRFTFLPEDSPVLVVVTAKGHVPRTRIVEAGALGTPVSLDLEPAGDDAVAFPFDVDVGQPGDGPRTASLLVSSNTPGAELGVMVGEAPRVEIPALRASDVHRFLVVHPDHADETIEVGPDAWATVDGAYGARVEVKLD